MSGLRILQEDRRLINCQVRFLVLFTNEISVKRKGTDQNTRVKENAGKHKHYEVDGAVARDDSQLGRCKAMEEIVSVQGRPQVPGSASCGCVSGSEMFEDADDRRRKLEYGWCVCVWANLKVPCDSGGGRGVLGRCQWRLPRREDGEDSTSGGTGMCRESRFVHFSSEE